MTENVFNLIHEKQIVNMVTLLSYSVTSDDKVIWQFLCSERQSRTISCA